MSTYRVEMTEDDLPMILRSDDEEIGRALTKRDGEAITAELNKAGNTALRDRLLSAVADAVEECFED